MMIFPPGVKAHLALVYTDMRKGMDGLAMLVQGTLQTGRRAYGSTGRRRLNRISARSRACPNP
jgi:hypothetical protein